eukprot:TRINITY_DN1815_c0_g2_i2.p1 TRINITY_DN1815_c0_g2~~TRINITY_DN1815_c0_g2_i2.p1  ORF type:complete len:289 (+),score=46.28 TRINITY_DN1815_c0_g2_i2:298-1164(+)
MSQYLDYVQGYNLTNRMPLWIKPNKKISVNDSMTFLRDHYENTWLDFSKDVGAEAYHAPYRWRPLTWESEGREYLNERAISTPQTGFTFVAQSRSWLPNAIGGILWFGVDDSAMSVRVPMYTSMTSIPSKWALGYGDLMTFKPDSAFWAFNLVSNWAYSRYSIIYPDVLDRIISYQNQYFNEVRLVDQMALSYWNQGNYDEAVKVLTEYSIKQANDLVDQWVLFFQELFVKYMDGYTKYPSSKPTPNVETPGYDAVWRQRIVEDTGDHYLIPDSKMSPPKSKLLNKIL